MKFDWTISLGAVVQIVVFIAMMAAAVHRVVRKFERRMDAMEQRIGPSDIPLTTRLSLLEQRVGDLWTWFKTTFGPGARVDPPGRDAEPQRRNS